MSSPGRAAPRGGDEVRLLAAEGEAAAATLARVCAQLSGFSRSHGPDKGCLLPIFVATDGRGGGRRSSPAALALKKILLQVQGLLDDCDPDAAGLDDPGQAAGGLPGTITAIAIATIGAGDVDNLFPGDGGDGGDGGAGEDGEDGEDGGSGGAPPGEAQPALVEVVPGLDVEAMVLSESCTSVASVRDAIRGPMLCYVPAWGHFALRLGGGLLHGNVGNIFPDGERKPCGVAECRKKSCRDPECSYYHDPALWAGHEGGIAPGRRAPLSVRNYMAGSFGYQKPPGAVPGAPARYGVRRFGSASSLGVDLLRLGPAEVRRFLDQVAHDVVCAALLLRHSPHAN